MDYEEKHKELLEFINYKFQEASLRTKHLEDGTTFGDGWDVGYWRALQRLQNYIRDGV